MDKQRGLDFLIGLIVGALIMFLAPRFLSKSTQKLSVTAVTSVQVPQPQAQVAQPPTLPMQSSQANQPAQAKAPAVAKTKPQLLPPPEFAPKLPQVLYSDAKGEVPLAWVPVENARRYQVMVTDDNGHRVQLSGWVHTDISLKGLPPPAPDESKRVYWVEIATQNKDQVAGEYGTKRKIVYLGKALSTPKIESIQVEE